MAEQKPQKKQKTEAKPEPAKAAAQPERKAEPKPESTKGTPLWTIAVIAAIVIIAIAAVTFYFVVPLVGNVPFQTFKSNFQSAPRVALAVTYLNQTQFSAEVPCYTTMLEIIGRTRNASTIDFLLINQTKCEYSPTGLGASASFITTNASSCTEIANNEPSIFMSYSATNSTKATQDHLYIEADSAYLASCPIAAEFG